MALAPIDRFFIITPLGRLLCRKPFTQHQGLRSNETAAGVMVRRQASPPSCPICCIETAKHYWLHLELAGPGSAGKQVLPMVQGGILKL
jgi:hypothetical protein